MCRNLYFVNGTKLHEKQAANESFSALQSRSAKKKHRDFTQYNYLYAQEKETAQGSLFSRNEV
jgi:hypothetical protein